MKIKFLYSVALAVISMAALAAANSVPVTFTNSASGLGGPANGIYYYPYQLVVNGTSMTVACDDFTDEVHLGESWNATVNSYSNLSQTLFYNGGTGVKLYDEAAWLYSQFVTTGPLKDTENAAINWAIWELFDTGHGPNDAFTKDPTTGNSGVNSAAYWLAKAGSQNLSGFDFSQFVVITPVNGWPAGDGRPQEYIGMVPEPASVVLLLTGFLALAGLAWRRRMVWE